MRKGSYFAASFWDSPIWQTLKGLPGDHLRVYLHLAHGPNSEISGLYRISVGQIAEDTDLDPDQVRSIVDDLVNVGWCDFEPPIIWIRGAGNICDQLGTRDFRRNASWITATERHVERLPLNRVVRAFCEFHRISPPEPSGVPEGQGPTHRDKEGIPAPSRHPGDTQVTPSREGADTLPTGCLQGADTQVDDSEQIRLGGAA
jgi:hypothetical protein